MSIKIKRPIAVKAIVTEALKEQLVHEVHAALEKMEREIAQIDYQGQLYLKKIESEEPYRIESINQQIRQEKQKRLESKHTLLERLKILAELRLGQEIVKGKIEGEYELSVGDSWDEVMSAEIVLKNGKVVEIREK